MNLEQARRCAETLEDVFTPEGDAVVVGLLRQEGLGPGRVKHWTARVSGGNGHEGKWFDIADLTAREDI